MQRSIASQFARVSGQQLQLSELAIATIVASYDAANSLADAKHWASYLAAGKRVNQRGPQAAAALSASWPSIEYYKSSVTAVAS